MPRTGWHVVLAALRSCPTQPPSPHPGRKAEKGRGLELCGREETDGWDADDADEYDRLLREIRRVAELVQHAPVGQVLHHLERRA